MERGALVNWVEDRNGISTYTDSMAAYEEGHVTNVAQIARVIAEGLPGARLALSVQAPGKELAVRPQGVSGMAAGKDIHNIRWSTARILLWPL